LPSHDDLTVPSKIAAGVCQPSSALLGWHVLLLTSIVDAGSMM
jgi:hypothetical protein